MCTLYKDGSSRSVYVGCGIISKINNQSDSQDEDVVPGTIFYSIVEALEHLELHKSKGDKVPLSAFEKMKLELH